MLFSPALNELIDALRCLPGVGPKSAQRMALHILERDRDGGGRLAHSLEAVLEKVGRCSQCRMFSETEVCPLCASSNRESSRVCIVEMPADLLAIEQGAMFSGRYFVLMGRLSPLDGIGPDELGLEQLAALLQAGEVEEVILATNATVEGEATAHYIAGLAREAKVAVSRIAQGVPMGGELEFVDGGTLAHAFATRQVVQ